MALDSRLTFAVAGAKLRLMETPIRINGPRFVHLKVHSAYSLLEGALPIGKLAKLTAAAQFPAIGLTDSNNLFGALEFSDKLWDAGVQPIVGCSLDVDFGDHTETQSSMIRSGHNEPRAQSAGRVALFAMNGEGYANLMRLSKCLFRAGAGRAGALQDRAAGGIFRRAHRVDGRAGGSG